MSTGGARDESGNNTLPSGDLYGDLGCLTEYSLNKNMFPKRASPLKFSEKIRGWFNTLAILRCFWIWKC